MHVFECRECGDRGERWTSDASLETQCEKCGVGYSRVVYDWGRSPAGFVPYVEDGLGDTPIKIESYEQLAKECRDRGLWAKRLDGGYKSY